MAIVVINKSGQEFADRFDGVDIDFPVGKKVLINEDAAFHIFGFGAADKVPFLSRLGWMKHSGELDYALNKLAQFTFQSFDPYAQLEDEVPSASDSEEATEEAEQQLSPVASGEVDEPVTDGTGDSTDSPQSAPATTSGSILSKLKGA